MLKFLHVLAAFREFGFRCHDFRQILINPLLKLLFLLVQADHLVLAIFERAHGDLELVVNRLFPLREFQVPRPRLVVKSLSLLELPVFLLSTRSKLVV